MDWRDGKDEQGAGWDRVTALYNLTILRFSSFWIGPACASHMQHKYSYGDFNFAIIMVARPTIQSNIVFNLFHCSFAKIIFINLNLKFRQNINNLSY